MGALYLFIICVFIFARNAATEFAVHNEHRIVK
jgi:hypothetical protein